MLDSSERLTLALAAGFCLSLVAVVYADNAVVWLVWGVVAVVVSGVALVFLNRSEPPPDP